MSVIWSDEIGDIIPWKSIFFGSKATVRFLNILLSYEPIFQTLWGIKYVWIISYEHQNIPNSYYYQVIYVYKLNGQFSKILCFNIGIYKDMILDLHEDSQYDDCPTEWICFHDENFNMFYFNLMLINFNNLYIYTYESSRICTCFKNILKYHIRDCLYCCIKLLAHFCTLMDGWE